jgi:hypothetical protein
VYWRWARADGVSKSYRHRVCVGCYAAKFLSVDLDYVNMKDLTCPSCGISTENDYDSIYATSFGERGARADLEVPYCGACAAVFRSWVIEHAIDVSGDRGAYRPPDEAPNAQGFSASQTMRALGR